MTGSKPGLAKRFFHIIWQRKAVIGLTVCVGLLVCLAAGSYLLYSRYDGLKSSNASLIAENSSLNEELEAVNSEATVLKAESERKDKRIRDTQEIFNYAKRLVAFPNIPSCDFGVEHLILSDLGQKNIGFMSGIEIKKGAHGDFGELVELMFYDTSSMAKFELIDQADAFIVEAKVEIDTPFGMDLLGLFKEADGAVCKKLIRAQFLNDLGALDEFKLHGFTDFSLVSKVGDETSELTLPYGSTFVDGSLFITDCSHNEVKIFDPAGHFVAAFGRYGNKTGFVDGVSDIQILNDRLFITESKNHRVTAFGPDGTFLNSWGSYGSVDHGALGKPGRFNVPIGLDVADDQIIVADHMNHRIQSLGMDGGVNWISGNDEDDDFDWAEPYYVRVDQDRELIYVSNRSRDNIGVLTFQGEKVRRFGQSILKYPHELDVGPDGRIYVADSLNNRLAIFDGPSDASVSFINTPKSWGYLKTISVSDNGDLAIGFVAGSHTFILVAKKGDGTELDVSEWQVTLRNPEGASVQPEYSAVLRTEMLYDQYCAGCHENGDNGAPITGNEYAWRKFPRKLSALTEMAIKGNGAMISMGGCDECSVQDIQDLIRKMAPMHWL